MSCTAHPPCIHICLCHVGIWLDPLRYVKISKLHVKLLAFVRLGFATNQRDAEFGKERLVLTAQQLKGVWSTRVQLLDFIRM